MLHRRIGTLSDLYVSGKTRTARYIPVWQLTGTWTGRYRAVPLRSAVGGRFKEKTTVGGRLRKKKERRRKRKRRRSTSHRPSGDSARGSPAAVAARAALALSLLALP
ncbi:hypothetical protein BHM03_00060669 [Ensete ventricosum]|nr:hypothetical protein BHM03_00060669 [Ensete ventricosum]